MYYIPVIQQYSYDVYAPRCCDGRSVYWMNPNKSKHVNAGHNLHLTDYGPKPFVININKATKQNNTFRTALWTGAHLQVTVMSLDIGEDIGLEIHSNL